MTTTDSAGEQKIRIAEPMIPELARRAARELLLNNEFYGTQEADRYYSRFMLRMATAYGAKIIPGIAELNSIIYESKPIVPDVRSLSIAPVSGVPTAESLLVLKRGQENIVITYGYDTNLYGARKVGTEVEYIRTDKELTRAKNKSYLSLDAGKRMDLTKLQTAAFIDVVEQETTEETFYKEISHEGHEEEVKKIIHDLLNAP